MGPVLLKRISVIWQADILIRFYLSSKAEEENHVRENTKAMKHFLNKQLLDLWFLI